MISEINSLKLIQSKITIESVTSNLTPPNPIMKPNCSSRQKMGISSNF